MCGPGSPGPHTVRRPTKACRKSGVGSTLRGNCFRDGDGRGQAKGHDAFRGHGNVFVTGKRGACGSGARTEQTADQCPLATAGQAADQRAATGPPANKPRAPLAFPGGRLLIRRGAHGIVAYPLDRYTQSPIALEPSLPLGSNHRPRDRCAGAKDIHPADNDRLRKCTTKTVAHIVVLCTHGLPYADDQRRARGHGVLHGSRGGWRSFWWRRSTDRGSRGHGWWSRLPGWCGGRWLGRRTAGSRRRSLCRRRWLRGRGGSSRLLIASAQKEQSRQSNRKEARACVSLLPW